MNTLTPAHVTVTWHANVDEHVSGIEISDRYLVTKHAKHLDKQIEKSPKYSEQPILGHSSFVEGTLRGFCSSFLNMYYVVEYVYLLNSWKGNLELIGISESRSYVSCSLCLWEWCISNALDERFFEFLKGELGLGGVHSPHSLCTGCQSYVSCGLFACGNGACLMLWWVVVYYLKRVFGWLSLSLANQVVR